MSNRKGKESPPPDKGDVEKVAKEPEQIETSADAAQDAAAGAGKASPAEETAKNLEKQKEKVKEKQKLKLEKEKEKKLEKEKEKEKEKELEQEEEKQSEKEKGPVKEKKAEKEPKAAEKQDESKQSSEQPAESTAVQPAPKSQRMAWPVPATLLMAAVVVRFLSNRQRKRALSRSHVQKAAGNIFLLGHTELLTYAKNGKAFKWFEKVTDESGDNHVGVVHFCVMGNASYLITSTEAAYLLFTKQSHLPKPRAFYNIFHLFGTKKESMLTTRDAAEHHALRSELSRFFCEDNVQKVFGVLAEEADGVTRRMLAASHDLPGQGADCDVVALTTALIDKVVLKVFFELDSSINYVDRAVFHDTVMHANEISRNPFAYDLLKANLMKGSRRYRRNFASLEASFSKMLKVFLARPVNPSSNAFWACILRAFPEAARDRQQRLSAIANIALVYGAGSETTANAVAYILAALCLDRESLDRLEQELDDAELLVKPGRPDPRPIAATDLPSLQFLEAVVHEGLRVFPPSPHGGRRILTRDTELPLGAKLLRGDNIMLCPWSLHRSTAIWGEDAKSWRPGRWLEGESVAAMKMDSQGYLRWMPFVTGAQDCIGQHLAMMEIRLAIVAIVGKMHIDLNAHRMGWHSVDNMIRDAEGFVTLSRRGGIWLRLRARDTSPEDPLSKPPPAPVSEAASAEPSADADSAQREISSAVSTLSKPDPSAQPSGVPVDSGELASSHAAPSEALNAQNGTASATSAQVSEAAASGAPDPEGAASATEQPSADEQPSFASSRAVPEASQPRVSALVQEGAQPSASVDGQQNNAAPDPSAHVLMGDSILAAATTAASSGHLPEQSLIQQAAAESAESELSERPAPEPSLQSGQATADSASAVRDLSEGSQQSAGGGPAPAAHSPADLSLEQSLPPPAQMSARGPAASVSEQPSAAPSVPPANNAPPADGNATLDAAPEQNSDAPEPAAHPPTNVSIQQDSAVLELSAHAPSNATQVRSVADPAPRAQSSSSVPAPPQDSAAPEASAPAPSSAAEGASAADSSVLSAHPPANISMQQDSLVAGASAAMQSATTKNESTDTLHAESTAQSLVSMSTPAESAPAAAASAAVRSSAASQDSAPTLDPSAHSPANISMQQESLAADPASAPAPSSAAPDASTVPSSDLSAHPAASVATTQQGSVAPVQALSAHAPSDIAQMRSTTVPGSTALPKADSAMAEQSAFIGGAAAGSVAAHPPAGSFAAQIEDVSSSMRPDAAADKEAAAPNGEEEEGGPVFSHSL